jgi:tetratricopeptide (TPR) repeat protein
VQEIERAIALAPHDAHFKGNLGATYLVQGRVNEAVETLREAVQIEPANAQLHSNLLLSLQYWREDDEVVFREHLGWREKFERSGTDLVRDGSPFTPPLPSGERSAPLKIGYVSVTSDSTQWVFLWSRFWRGMIRAR